MDNYTGSPIIQTPTSSSQCITTPLPEIQSPTSGSVPQAPNLPAELLADILDHVGDWELSTAVGVRTSLKRPREWDRATPIDEAALTGSLPRMLCYSSVSDSSLTKLGAMAILKMGYVHIVDHLYWNERELFEAWFGRDAEVIPKKASQFGRVEFLDWWISLPPRYRVYGVEAIDEACRSGHLNVLEWWWERRGDRFQTFSGLQLKYTEAALENASAKGHIHVLNWWRNTSGLPLKIGRVLDMASRSGNIEVLDWWVRSGIEVKYDNFTLYNASCSGRVEVLKWWHESSGLQMMFDRDVLTGATRYNQPEVLDWWDKSGLDVQFRICDIEEALEDAIRPGAEAKEWWEKKGVNFHTNNTEWTKVKSLLRRSRC
jgi:hypothetical protein